MSVSNHHKPSTQLGSTDEGRSIDKLRSLLVSTAKESAFRKVVQATMIRDRQHGPVVELNRISIGNKKTEQSKKSVCNSTSSPKTVFEQMVIKMASLTTESLLLPHRAWKVKFVGESVDDCGGGYSESIAEMCDELSQCSIEILIPTPNGRDESGTSRDCLLLNPSLTSHAHLNQFK